MSSRRSRRGWHNPRLRRTARRTAGRRKSGCGRRWVEGVALRLIRKERGAPGNLPSAPWIIGTSLLDVGGVGERREIRLRLDDAGRQQEVGRLFVERLERRV